MSLTGDWRLATGDGEDWRAATGDWRFVSTAFDDIVFVLLGAAPLRSCRSRSSTVIDESLGVSLQGPGETAPTSNRPLVVFMALEGLCRIHPHQRWG